MTLLLDAGARAVAAPRDAGEEAARQHALFPDAAPAASDRPRTLDDVLSGTWEHLTAGISSAACPVCDGELAPRWSAGAGVVGGRCHDCGTELS